MTMPLSEEMLCFYFSTIKREAIHIGKKYVKINNGNHFSLTSLVICPDPEPQWSALWLTADATERLVPQLLLISLCVDFLVLCSGVCPGPTTKA